MNDVNKTEIVIYKNKKYTVTNPGELVFSKTRRITKSKDKETFEIVDQLNNCSEIKNYRRVYLMNTYGITELEYYIIVVLRGDETQLPKCEYISPYTGEICNNPKKFRTLVPGVYQKTGNKQDIFFCGCVEHSLNAAAQKSQTENYIRGVTGLQKADRNSRAWREKLSAHAKKQMEEGRSIFSPDNIRDKSIPGVDTFRLNATGIGMYEDIANRLGISILDFKDPLEYWIFLDKEYYIYRGNPEDVCHYYITMFEENDTLFKLGVTNDLETRSIGYSYHGMTYLNPSILFTSSRKIIANLEYDVKLYFKNKIKLGHEAFSVQDKDEILKFINERIDYYKNDEAES